MTHGKKKIFNVTTREEIEVDLTPEEVAERDAAAIQHEKEQIEFAKTQYLRDRKKDPNWPTLEEMVWALWRNDKTVIEARIAAIEAKYPGSN